MAQPPPQEQEGDATRGPYGMYHLPDQQGDEMCQRELQGWYEGELKG